MKYCRIRSTSRLIAFWTLLLVALPPLLLQHGAFQARAQGQVQMSASLRTGPQFPIGRWLPFELRVENRSGSDIDGTIQVSRLELPAGPLSLSRAARVPANAKVSLDYLVQLPEPPARDKKGTTKPVIEFLFKSGAEATLVREPVIAISDSMEGMQGREATGIPGVIFLSAIVLNDQKQIIDPSELDEFDISDLSAALSHSMPFTVTPTASTPEALFRRAESFDACRMVAIDVTTLNELDAAQRQALLQHVQSGATLIIAEPLQSLQSTWISPYLPMDAVNERVSAAIETPELGKLSFHRTMPEYECVLRDDAPAGSVHVVASNERGVVAAYREVGLGRIAMTAFALNSLDLKQPASIELWKRLIGAGRSTFHNPDTLLESPAVQEQLPSMIGATAPPWRTAAVVVGVYVAVVVLVLTFSGPRWRPLAFGACAIFAALVAAGVVALSSAGATSDAPLMAASVNVVDVEGHVARQEQLVTFYSQSRGQERSDLSVSAAPGTLITPIILSDEATLTMFPLRYEGLSASSGKLNTVLRAETLMPASAVGAGEAPVAAKLSFDAMGAQLAIEGLEAPLVAARLTSRSGIVFPLRAPAGTGAGDGSAKRVGPRNLPGVWNDGSSMIASEEAKLRDELVRATEAPPSAFATTGVRVTAEQASSLRLIAFMEQSPTTDTITLPEGAIRKEQTMVRVPVTILPAAAGSEVKIEPGLVQVRREMLGTNAPFTPETETWNESSQNGEWLMALLPPTGLGKLDPKTLSLQVDLRATGFELSILRGQVKGGKVRANPSGEAILQWNNASGPRQAQIELTADDVDANGWVWVLLKADMLPATPGLGLEAMTPAPPWQVVRFEPTITGTVTGPTEPTRVTWEIEPPPKPRQPAGKPAAKPPAKPAAKPAAKAPAQQTDDD